MELETGAVEDSSVQVSELELALPTSLVAWGPRDIETERKNYSRSVEREEGNIETGCN